MFVHEKETTNKNNYTLYAIRMTRWCLWLQILFHSDYTLFFSSSLPFLLVCYSIWGLRNNRKAKGLELQWILSLGEGDTRQDKGIHFLSPSPAFKPGAEAKVTLYTKKFALEKRTLMKRGRKTRGTRWHASPSHRHAVFTSLAPSNSIIKKRWEGRKEVSVYGLGNGFYCLQTLFFIFLKLGSLERQATEKKEEKHQNRLQNPSSKMAFFVHFSIWRTKKIATLFAVSMVSFCSRDMNDWINHQNIITRESTTAHFLMIFYAILSFRGLCLKTLISDS